MPGLVMHGTSSLERLKALDNLPTLDAQLGEIKQLCTHSARAEMIAKWLFGKLQSDSEARQSSEAWNGLQTTLRILSSERIATILSASKVLKAAQRAVQEHERNTDLLQSITRLLNFLLEQSNASDAVALRAGLSLPSTEAAQFFGVWLRILSSIPGTHRNVALDDLLSGVDVALQVWSLRKRSSDDNEAFSKHCLVPCAALLSHFGSDGPDPMIKKRKYDEESAKSNPKTAVESLLARHIFLPARAAFFNARASVKTKKVGSQRPSYVIESLLEPLKGIVEPIQDDEKPPLESLPSLLDIALRSAPTLSPTQRSHEKPWIETLFLALLDLDKTQAGQLIDAEALCGMLRVIARRSCTLSSGLLKDLVATHAGLSDPANDDINCDLVAAVVGVDAALFKDDGMSRTLFDTVTRASVRLGEDVVQSLKTRPTEFLQALWRDRIVVPVLKAFARYNDLENAVKLCAEQLKKDLHGTFWSVWNHLDQPIQELMEESLTDDQVLSLTLGFCRTVTEFNDRREIEERPKLNAAIVMLNALLGGIRSDDVLERLRPTLESTFEALMELHDAHIGDNLVPALQERRCWALMKRIFELWYPSFAAQERDPNAAAARLGALVPRSVLDRAVQLGTMVHPDSYGSVEDPKSASDAKCFVASVCTQALAHKGSVNDSILQPYIDVLNALQGNEEDSLSFDAFVLYPNALDLMSSAIRQDLLQRFARDATGLHAQDAAEHLQILKNIGSNAAALLHSSVIEDLVEASLSSLEEDHTKAEGDAVSRAFHFVKILSGIHAKALSRTQREKILDKICDFLLEHDLASAEVLKACLPTILRLMELSNATARICLDAAVVMNMAKALESLNGRDDGTTSASFEALVSIIIQQCIRTKDQERSREMLVGLSTESTKIIKASVTANGGHTITQLVVVKAVLRDLETDGLNDLKSHFPHRKSSNLKKFNSSLAATIELGLQDSEADVVPALELLKSVPLGLASTSGLDIAALLASLAIFMERMLATNELLDTHQRRRQALTSSEVSIMVCCYQILGKFAPATTDPRLAMFGDRLLQQLPLNARDHAAVLATFDGLLANLGSSRASLALKLLDESPLPASRLALLRHCIEKLEKIDFEESEEFSPTRILYGLLMALSGSKDFTVCRRVLACIVDVLKAKPFMVNQYNVETTLQVLYQLAQRSGPGKSVLYLDICSTVTALLLHHRSRLQGRFHMMIKLLQALMSRLFQPLQGWDKEAARRPPTAKHAQALARLLKLFCEPPQLRKTQQLPSLVDESRKEQAHVGTFVQHVLHHYCVQVLYGTLGEGMKDALTAGLRAMIEAMEMNGAEGGKALSAAMNGSERAVLRGLYEEWRRFGKWRGG